MTVSDTITALSLSTKEEIADFLEDFFSLAPDIMGINEIIVGNTVTHMDPYGSGATPRYIKVRLRGQYAQDVWWLGSPDLDVGDDCIVIHLREGNRYMVLPVSVTGGGGGAQTFFVQAVGGYNETAGTDLINNDSYFRGIALPWSANSYCIGHFLVPDDFDPELGDMSIVAVVIPDAPDGTNIRVQNQACYGKCDELYDTHTTTSGWQTVNVDDTGTDIHHCILEICPDSAEPDDIVHLRFDRDGNSEDDDYEGPIYVPGWTVDYYGCTG